MASLGIAALSCYAIHALFHLFRGEWYDLFWACHVAAIFVGIGLLTQSATINDIGVLLGLMGLPLWLADLAGGSEFLPTSLLTHVVALCIGLYGVARLGMPRGTWWKSAAVLVGLIGICRVVTPPEQNVNVAFAIQHGWERQFASHQSYLVSILSGATVYFFVVERLVRLLISRRQKQLEGTQPPVELTTTPQVSSR